MLTRKQQQQRKQREQQEKAAKAKLAKQLGRNPDGTLPKSVKKKDDGSSLKLDYRTSDVKHVPSAEGRVVEEEGVFLEEGHDWAAREQAAQEEIEHKKKRTAPLWNKGGYMYISDEEDPTTLGRKV
uniref:Uncharacterized protein n=1 Tax=Pseudomonas phage HRDY3 TaxID=3236930 RepID=A0AB39CDQ8_9VIRU